MVYYLVFLKADLKIVRIKLMKKKKESIETIASNQKWTFLSHHAHILICINRDPTVRVRDMAINVGITERAIMGIIEDMVTDGIMVRVKEGRRNKYKINKGIYMRHKLKNNKTVGDLLKLFG